MSFKTRLATLEGKLAPRATGVDAHKELWDYLVRIDERLGEVDPTEEWCRRESPMTALVVALRYWTSRQPPEPVMDYIRTKAREESPIGTLFANLEQRYTQEEAQ